MATKRNYNQMSNKQVEEVVEPVVETEAPVAKEEKKKIVGTVGNCERLNVRKEPAVGSEIVCVINKNTEVTIDKDANDDFYKVRFKSDNRKSIVGYCMKKYIVVTK